MRFSGYRHKYPFLRLLVPLIGGIYSCGLLSGMIGKVGTFACISMLLSLFLLFFYSFVEKYSRRWLWGVSITFFFFFLGVFVTAVKTEKSLLKNVNGTHTFVAYVTEPPQEKAKSILCTLHMVEYWDSLQSHSVDRKILLYLSKDSLSSNVRWGDKLLVYAKVTPPRNNGNPDEFDYARYLFHRGVSGTSFVSSGKWKWLSPEKTFDLRQQASSCREFIMDIYRRLGFSGDGFSVLSALTLGYKEELSEEIRQAYSVSGVSHVLALSGLHIGLLYVLLEFMLGWANRYKALRIVKLLFIIISLWAFAFITGLPPSVLRSVSMFSLVAFSVFFSGRSVSLNTLAVAAFFMLLFNPFYLYDVGFQLSFLSVGGIVILQPQLYRRLKVESHFLKYLWGLVTVSLAAQLVTAPLVMFYFGTFPIHFLWTNIVVIPLVTFILYIAVVMLIVGFFTPLQEIIAFVLNGMVGMLNRFTSYVEHLPVSSVENIHFTQIDVLGFYSLIILTVVYLLYHKRGALFAALCCLLVLSLFHFNETFKAGINPSILFYNNRTCPSVHFIASREKSYLLSVREDSVIEHLKYAAGRFWNIKRIATPLLLPKVYEKDGIFNDHGITCFGGRTVCLVNDNRWRNKVAVKPFPVDYLYVCNGYKGDIIQLAGLFAIRKVVLDSSLSDYRLAFLKEECIKLGLDFISISEKGSYRIDL